MAVGECWHSKVKVAPDGTAPDVVIQVRAGSYLVLAKVSFVQKAPYSIDSSGGVQKTTYEDSRGLLQLVFDEYESQKVVDSCEAQFGAAEYSLEPILEFPHKIDQPDFKIVGWTVHGLAGGVAVINARVQAMGRGADLRLDISTHNTEVVEGTMSVIEVSIPPRQAPHPGPLPA